MAENEGLDPNVMAALAAAHLEFWKPLVEQAMGYKMHCMSLGFNDSAATQMAVDFHGMIMKQFSAAAGK